LRSRKKRNIRLNFFQKPICSKQKKGQAQPNDPEKNVTKRLGRKHADLMLEI
jgi:hypothetical protein